MNSEKSPKQQSLSVNKSHNVPLTYSFLKIFFIHDRGRYHIETSPFICSANQLTGLYMITASVMKELSYIFDGICTPYVVDGE